MALNEILKGMSNAAEAINNNFKNVLEKEDSGWTRSSGLLGDSTGEVNYKKKNGLITVYGYVTPTPGGTGNLLTAKTVFNIPEGFRSDHSVYFGGVPASGSTNFPENHGAVIEIASNGNIIIQKASAMQLAYRFEMTYYA